MLHSEVNKWQLWWWRREHFGHRYKFSSLLSDWMGDVVAECEDGAARLILTDTRVWKLKLNLQSRSSDEWQRSSGFWLLTGSDQTLRSAAGLGRWCVRVCSHIRWNLYDQWNVLWMFQRIKYLPNILQVTFKKKTQCWWRDRTEHKSPSCCNDTLNSTGTARSENTRQEPAVFHNCCLSG